MDWTQGHKESDFRFHFHLHFYLKKIFFWALWCLSCKEPARQCRRHRLITG